MPTMSGKELAHRLRAQFPAGELTLVALSGHDKGTAPAIGGEYDHHLLKPASPQAIAALLVRIAQEEEPEPVAGDS
jgi:YesN/AraC family two-component response regulator